MRVLSTAIAAIVLSTVSAQAQSTTRIETRPYYGYVVTVDKGVRVWRPLPPHDRVIINPEGRTPLSLSFNDHRHTSSSHNTHAHRYEGAGSGAGGAAPSYFYPSHRRAVKRTHGDAFKGHHRGHYRVPGPVGKH